MNIYYLSASRLISDTANSIHVMRMCDAFTSAGHHVTLSGLKGSGNKEEIFRYYGVTNQFQLALHNEDDHALVAMLWSLRKRVSFLRVGGIPSVLYGRLVIAPALRASSVDLIYARNLDWLAGVGAGIPFVAESHNPPANPLERFMEKQIYTRPEFLRLVVISNRLKEIYLSLFPFLDGRIIVAHDAADDPGPVATKVNCGGFHVGYVGHLYPGRGAELIRQLAKNVPEATFHIVGGTRENQGELVKMGLADNIVLHGHIPPSELKRIFPNFDVVLAPYQRKVSVGRGRLDTSDYMSPLKVFEYMAWGKAILCSDIPVLREVLRDQSNAILLDPEDGGAWARKLRWLIDCDDERQQLGGQARRDFLAQHTWRQRAELVLNGL